MSTVDRPATVADQVQKALRDLAHATRAIEDPRETYSILGSLSSAVASLSQSLHQLGAAHDNPSPQTGWMRENSPRGQSAGFRASWELHRAGQILGQAGDAIDAAHRAEAAIRYDPAPPQAVPNPTPKTSPPALQDRRAPSRDGGLGL